uniref:Uncharacterized protein n=1 Tax=Laticauda laticaudata TaxID=8630 RepID=A0A8C5SGU8_LATLA
RIQPATKKTWEQERRRAQAANPTNQLSLVQQAASAQGHPAGGAIARRHRTPKVPLLEVKYGGDPKELGFFLAQIWSHMKEYGENFSLEAAKVKCVTRALEETAAKWMVTLHNDNAPQLMNYDLFMTALHTRFEDPLAEHKTRIRMKTINQWRRSLACHIRGWSHGALIEGPVSCRNTFFKDRQNQFFPNSKRLLSFS